MDEMTAIVFVCLLITNELILFLFIAMNNEGVYFGDVFLLLLTLTDAASNSSDREYACMCDKGA